MVLLAPWGKFPCKRKKISSRRRWPPWRFIEYNQREKQKYSSVGFYNGPSNENENKKQGKRLTRAVNLTYQVGVFLLLNWRDHCVVMLLLTLQHKVRLSCLWIPVSTLGLGKSVWGLGIQSRRLVQETAMIKVKASITQSVKHSINPGLCNAIIHTASARWTNGLYALSNMIRMVSLMDKTLLMRVEITVRWNICYLEHSLSKWSPFFNF